MSLSANIKRLRLARELTQEQLAARLGISAQAVSKWETSETYPDGTLLVPLARELGVSLDVLFDNDVVSMADISGRILALIRDTEAQERFSVARELGWQIERGLFNSRMEISKEYDPQELRTLKHASYILDDTGFTVVSNGETPFFSVFPQPEGGYGHAMDDADALRDIFEALSRAHTLCALKYLYQQPERYVFEREVLARDCDIPQEMQDTVMDDLLLLRMIAVHRVTVNGQERMLCYTHQNHRLLALLIMARELNYRGAHSLQAHHRNAPFFGQA